MRANRSLTATTELINILGFEKDGIGGYVGTGVEILDPSSRAEIREAYDISPYDAKTRFPENELPEFRLAALELYHKCHIASLDILEALAIGLKLENPAFFTENHKFIGTQQNTTDLRMLHYPPLPDDVEPGTARCGAHSDYGSITLLFQDDIGGLEVMDRQGRWIPAPPEPGAVIVNTGDLLQFWTSDRIIATPHRVLVPENEKLWKSERRSIAFFGMPDNECVVKPLDGSDKYPPVTSKQHILNMLNKTYH